jgi:sporulation protein YlmC with PRC-barrel domain
MLQLSVSFTNQPIMSLRTGTEISRAYGPIINPNNLKIEGFYCQDPENRKNTLILLNQDVRDIIPQGIVVNDMDVLTDATELVRLKEIISYHFELLGKPVVDTDNKRLGKIEDYSVDIESLYVQKLYISQSMFKSFTGGNLGIDRSDIVEITEKKIVIRETMRKAPMRAGAPA